MKLRKVPKEKLNPAEYNPRVSLTPDMDEYQRLKRSLDEFGMVQPIVWNERTGNIVSGHQRFRILSDEGEKEFDVIAVSLDPEQEKALNITLNNSRVGGDWDTQKLTDIISELAEIPDFDETLTGFSQQEIRNFLFDPDYEPYKNIDLEEDQADELVKVLLKIPADHWEALQPELNDLLSRIPDMELHVL